MPIAQKRTAASGGADAQAANITDLWNNLDAVLVAAGWTLNATVASGKYYTSTGETGLEKIFLIVQLTGTTLNIKMPQFMNTAPSPPDSYNMLGNTANGFTDLTGLTAGTYDYVICADKDSFGLFFRRTDATIWHFSAGLLRRAPDVNANVMITNAAFVAGTNVVVDVTPSNPAALGYQVGDIVSVVAQQTAINTATSIPIFTARIVSVGANSITLDKVPAGGDGSVSAGARVGEDPMPFYMTLTNAGAFWDYEAANGVTINFIPRPGVANIYTASPSNGVGTFADGYYCATRSDVVPLDTQLRPNQRTNRNVLARFNTYNGDPGSSLGTRNVGLSGNIDKIFHFTNISFALWDIARTIKTSPVHDYVLYNNGANWYAIGPIN